jgi:hypothetical protein
MMATTGVGLRIPALRGGKRTIFNSFGHVCYLAEVNKLGCRFAIIELNYHGIADVKWGEASCTVSLCHHFAFGAGVLEQAASSEGGIRAGSFSSHFALCLAGSRAAPRFPRSIRTSVRHRQRHRSPRSSGHAGRSPPNRAKRSSSV